MARNKTKARHILHGLSSADPGPAWSAFLDRYAALIYRTIGQFDLAADGREDCFLAVCEKLYQNDFRRLLAFNPAGRASFSGWLSTVVFNLCVDWHRAEFGRATVLPAIQALPAFDRLVYRHCYERGMSREACFRAIQAEFPEFRRDQLGASLARIHQLLTPRQRWQLAVRQRRRGGDVEAAELLAEPPRKSEPDVEADAERQAAELRKALEQLPVNQRLLLHLRFRQGLSFARIAKMEHLGDAHRARRHVQRALDALYRQLQRIRKGQKRQT